MTRKCLVGLGAIILILTAAAPSRAQAPDREVEGVYRCEGTNPDGSRYRGVVEIRKDADTYRVSWTMSQRASALGIGILRGDVLAVSYFTGESLGIVAYRMEKGGQLIGEWAVLGAGGQIRPETLSRMGMLADDDHHPGDEIALVPTGASEILHADPSVALDATR
jgi:hypothetical protein